MSLVFKPSYQIDTEGYFINEEGLRVIDIAWGAQKLDEIEFSKGYRGSILNLNNKHFVQSMDHSLVVHSIDKIIKNKIYLSGAYGYKFQADLGCIYLDPLDRFCGYDSRMRPFVLTRKAQNQFFDMLDSFTDESIEVDGQTYAIEPWYLHNPAVEDQKFWDEKYKAKETPWDLGEPNPVLVKSLAKLKMPVSRVLCLGVGAGHDANYFASLGHHVTAVDVSEVALKQAQEQYPSERIHWVQADALVYQSQFEKSFDIVFEHTLFCALNPEERQSLIPFWKRYIDEQGYFMGVFFTMSKREGPPFGCTEWELQTYLAKHKFKSLIWKRSFDSVESRRGHELFVYGSFKN